MQMSEVKCRNCGAPMEYVTGIRHLKCAACGSEFILEGNGGLTPLLYNGGPLFMAYIPEGWNYNIFQDTDDYSKYEPICFGFTTWSEEARITYFPRAFYSDCNSLGYHVDGMTITNHHKYLPIDDYVPQRLREIFPQAQEIAVGRLEDQLLQQKAAEFVMQAGQIVKDADCAHGKYEISFSVNGQRMHGIFGTILCFPRQSDTANGQSGTGSMPPNAGDGQQGAGGAQQKAKMDLGFFMRGGLIGALARGESVGGLGNIAAGIGNLVSGLGIGGSTWGRAFDVLLVTPLERTDLFDGIFNDFALNVNYGPQYAALQQQEMAAVQNIQIQGAMTRQQNQIAASQRLSQTIAQRNDIIMSGYEQRSARMDHMRQQYSEANRGVNSYTDNSGRTVEAGVRFDHVYQNGSTFVGSEQNLDLGPGWQELKRNE